MHVHPACFFRLYHVYFFEMTGLDPNPDSSFLESGSPSLVSGLTG